MKTVLAGLLCLYLVQLGSAALVADAAASYASQLFGQVSAALDTAGR